MSRKKLLPVLARREADQLPGLQLGGLHTGRLQLLPGVQIEIVIGSSPHTLTHPVCFFSLSLRRFEGLPPLGEGAPVRPLGRMRGRLSASCHASPVRDGRLPCVSDLKQARFAALRFRALAPVHPPCSRRLSASPCHASHPPRRRISRTTRQNPSGAVPLLGLLPPLPSYPPPACSRVLSASFYQASFPFSLGSTRVRNGCPPRSWSRPAQRW